jgi:hypothetical protein
MREPSAYGRYYWCVRIPQVLSQEIEKSGVIEATVAAPVEIYLYGDECAVSPSGALEFRRVKRDKKTGEEVTVINMALAPDEWICAYEADPEDGHAVAVEA